MLSQDFKFMVDGHVKVEDDLGTVLVDKKNAVHPQNVARIISRAIANEDNYWIHRIAYGNGGTEVDAAFQVTYKTPNDGQSPDPAGWESRLYNETYSEVINETSVDVGTDPSGGGGSNPAGDPPSIEHVSGPGVRSNELGLTSEVVITSILNPGEPTGQSTTDGNETNTESDFTFDEIGLYTTGAPDTATTGFQSVDVGDKKSTDDTGLAFSTAYGFTVTVDGGAPQEMEFTTPASGSGPSGEITFGDICEALNTSDPAWTILNNSVSQSSGVSPAIVGATVAITDVSGNYASIVGAQTFGHVRVTSNSTGSTSSILLLDGVTAAIADLFAGFSPIQGTILTAVAGGDQGIQNDPVNSINERERLLTHLIFSPVLKSANRTLTVTYTLTINVARSV